MKHPAKSWSIGAAALVLGFLLGGFVCRGSNPDSNHREASHEHAERPADSWTCSMHPQIRQDEPGKCPICGMNLVPIRKGNQAAVLSESQLALSDRARTLSQIQTTEVTRQTSRYSELRLLGKIQPNETTLKTVTAWTGGRIDRLFVNTTGEKVRAGQTIATIYSPEVYAAHQDLLIAARQATRGETLLPQARVAGESALQTAKERLRLLGVPERTIKQLQEAETPTTSLQIHTPFAGTVIERIASEGTYVSTGTPLYRIANLSSLWVQLEAYESDVARLSHGQTVQISIDALPGRKFSGRVAFIDPTIDPARRVAQVRVEVRNKSGDLRPGMFATALIQLGTDSSSESPIVIPRTAPLFTGTRSLVYVEIEHDDRYIYEARPVVLGPQVGDSYIVLAGLVPGERVVNRGAFALDADLQIRGGTSMMNRSDDTEVASLAISQVDKRERLKLGPLISTYLGVHHALASDDLPQAIASAQSLAEISAPDLLPHSSPWQSLQPKIVEHSKLIASSESLERARQAFNSLSLEIVELLRTFGSPLEQELRITHCPMASGGTGALWIQTENAILNPYFGPAMLECGSIEEQIPAGQYALPEVDSDDGQANRVRGHQH